MAWEDILVVNVPGGVDELLADIDPSDRDAYAKGFVQQASITAASQWIMEARRLSSPEREYELETADFAHQLEGVAKAWAAIQKAYRAMNLRWQYDPKAAEIWIDEYGSFYPDETLCHQLETGPKGFFGAGPASRQMARMIELWEKIKGRVARTSATIPQYDPADEVEYRKCQKVYIAVQNAPFCKEPERLSEQYVEWKTLNAVLVVPAFLDYSDEIVVLNTAAQTTGSVASQNFDGMFVGAGCYMPPRMARPILTTPIEEDTATTPGTVVGTGATDPLRVNQTPVNINPNAVQSIQRPPNGVFTLRNLGATDAINVDRLRAMSTNVHLNPNQFTPTKLTLVPAPGSPEEIAGEVAVWPPKLKYFVPLTYLIPEGPAVEVDRATTDWTWDCFRWDDAPGETIRLLPPLRWSLHVARRIAQVLYDRGPRQTIMDTRTWSTLENIRRSLKYHQTPDELLRSTLTQLERESDSKHKFDKDWNTFNSVASAGCGIVTAANPLAGGVCGIVLSAINGIKMLVQELTKLQCDPIGRFKNGCDCELDRWGQPADSPVEPRLSLDDPPFKEVAPPKNFQGTFPAKWLQDSSVSKLEIPPDSHPIIPPMENSDANNPSKGSSGTGGSKSGSSGNQQQSSGSGGLMLGVAAAAALYFIMQGSKS